MDESLNEALTRVTWAQNPWDGYNQLRGAGLYVLEVFEYDCDDFVAVASSWSEDAIKALADEWDLSNQLIDRYGGGFTPGEARVNYCL